MSKKLKILTVLTGFFLVLNLYPAAQAALNAVDPGPYTAATGFFPLWYQDTNGVPLELCLTKTASPNPGAAGGLLCTLLPDPGFDVNLPVSFPGNFPEEAFWFTADARVRGVDFDVSLIIALEAAFSPEGFQLSFARVRLRGIVGTAGVYTFTHPYGTEVLEITDTTSRGVNYTRDIGIGAPGIFTPALAGDIGPFLVRIDNLGNPSPIVIGTETYLGDPNVLQPVTGSPFGTNFFRIQGPRGVDATDNLFSISGKVYTGAALPTPIALDRASYSRGPFGLQMDVFATAPPTAALSVTDSGVPPYPVTMTGDPRGHFFGQVLAPPALFGPVNLTANNRPYNLVSIPANTVATSSSPVTDLIFITKAEYASATQTLTIEAASSDATGPITLSAAGFGDLAVDPLLPAPAQRLVLAPVVIPPAAVTVTSSAGGSDREEVIILP